MLLTLLVPRVDQALEGAKWSQALVLVPEVTGMGGSLHKNGLLVPMPGALLLAQEGLRGAIGLAAFTLLL